MATFNTGQAELSPASRLTIDSSFSLVRCKIEGQTERSVVVSGPGIDGTSTIGSRLARSDAGVLIIRVGDHDEG